MPSSTRASSSLEERIAWYAVLALPVAVPLVVGAVPFTTSGPFAQNPVVYPKTLMLAALVALACSAWAVGVWRGTLAPRKVPGRWMLVAFLGLAGLSTVFALCPTWAFFGGEFLRVGLLVMLLCVAVYLLAVQLVTTPRRIRQLSWACVAGGAVVAAVAVLQSRGIDFLGTSRDNMYVFLRGPSLLGNPDYTATYLVVVLLVAVGLALSERDGRLRWLAAGAAGLTLLSIALSLTRGAWVGTIVGLVALLIAATRSRATRRTAWLAAGLLLAVLVVGVAIKGPAEFAKRFEDLASAETAGDTRLVMWGEAVSVIADRPLLGTGPDSYSLGWYKARSVTSMEQSGIAATHGDPHNVVLLLAATLGLPAGLLAVAMVVLAALAGAPTVFRRSDERAVTLFAGWWAALLGLSAALLFAPHMIVLPMMLALVAAVVVAPKAGKPVASTAIVRPLAMAAAAASLVLFVLSAITLTADIELKQATSESDLAKVDSAVRTAPWHAEARYIAAYAHVSAGLAALGSSSVTSDLAIDAAEERLEALIRQNPYKYGSYTLKANFLLELGRASGSAELLTRARAAAQQAQALYPLSAEAAELKAQCDEALGETGAALDALERLWNIDPFYSAAGIHYVRLLMDAGRTAEAKAAYAELKAKHPWDQQVLELEASLEASSTPQ